MPHTPIRGRGAGFVAQLDLLGPVRLRTADQVDQTPSSPLRQALLGVIGLAGETGVSRARLQDLFWGDKAPDRAAQSLRTALHALRRDVGGFDPGILDIDAHSVRLAPGRVRVDALAFMDEGAGALSNTLLSDPPDLLEGIDIAAEGFEEWLRDQRNIWHDRLRVSVPARPVLTPEPTSPLDLRRIVALLPAIIQSQSPVAICLGEGLLDRIAEGLREYTGARVFDYRDGGNPLPEDSARLAGPDLFLRVRLHDMPGGVSFRVLVSRHATQDLLFSVQSGSIPLDRARLDAIEVLDLLGEVIERVSAIVARLPRREADAPITPFHALSAMFQIEHDALDDLHDALMRAWDVTDAAIYPALLAYLNTFRVGEHWGGPGNALEEETRHLINQVRGHGDVGGLATGLAAHALGYVLHEHEAAGDLFDRAIRMAPQSAVCWDHLALHCTYVGNYDRARIASGNALRIGAFSPIEFTMQTTRSMIATLEGDFGTATQQGALILSQRPKFGAALRYSAISQAHLGQIEAARDCVNRIRQMDPSFSVDWVHADRMAVRDAQAKTILIEGLTRAGAG